MTNDLFEENKGEDQPEYDLTKPLHEQLVGDGRKFKDDELLAAAKIESDRYIKTLERQLDTMRSDYEQLDEEYKSGASLRELVDQFKAQQQQLASSSNNQNANEVKQPVVDETKLDNLIETKFIQKEEERKFQKNLSEVKSKLQEKFGTNYQPHLKQHVEDLGLSIEDFNALARKSPKALFKTLGFEVTKSEDDLFQAPPRNQTRSDSFKPQSVIRDWAYYEKMRQENPKLYKDSRTHVQMHKDADEIDARYGPGTFMRKK